jgi:hypothetical protein
MQFDPTSKETTDADPEELGGESTIEYHCTPQELEEAGLHDGCTVGYLEEMPEVDSEFIPDPHGEQSLIRDGAGLGELVELLDIDPCPAASRRRRLSP